MTLAAAASTLEISCQNCGAALLVEPHLRTAECPYCASSSVVDRPPSAGRVDPTFALGFVVERARARDICKRWIKSRKLARSGFTQAMPERGRGLYMPAYLYGAVAHADYTCEIGENYTETYTTTDSKGKRVTRTRTRTEWRSLQGRHSSYVQDVLVTASKGIANELFDRVEPFDLRALRRYTPALISGWIAEEASMDAETCRELARKESLAEIGSVLEGFMPGDHHRNLLHTTQLREEVAELLLVPVWVFAVRHAEDQPPVQVLVNGQTGSVAGDVPRSWIKITLLVLGLLAGLAGAVLVIAMLRS